MSIIRKEFKFLIVFSLLVSIHSQGVWVMVWHDEFTSENIDFAKWIREVGAFDFNDEKEIYTNFSNNSYI